jgi:hypothetical protein
VSVAHDAVSEDPTGTSASAANPQTWTHTPSGTPKGVLVFTISAFGGGSTDGVSGCTYGGVAMTEVAVAHDTASEPAHTRVFFLGASIPTGAQTVSVSKSAGCNTWCVAITVTAAGDTETTGSVLLQEDGTLAQQSVDDGSPGTNSMRYAGGFWGASAIPGLGANSTTVHDIDVGTSTARVVRETTAGQGSRLVGFTDAGSEDRAIVHIAIKEVSADQSKSSSDANGTTTEAVTETASSSSTDVNGTVTESSAVSVPISASDTNGATTETSTPKATYAVSEANETTAETNSLVSAIAQTEVNGTTSESGSAGIAIAASDTGSSSEAQTSAAAFTVSDANISVTEEASVPELAQFIRPDADVTTTGWTVVPLWSKIDESVADDGDFITATAA